MSETRRRGVVLHYEIEGSGSPLLLHTGGGGDLEMWRLAGYTQALRTDHRLILMDHRGHGKSGRPEGLSSHRVEEYRDDVLAVLDDIGIDRAAFLGYSAGAKIGYAVADTYPDRISALIDLDGMEADFSEKSAGKNARKFVRDVKSRGWTAILAEMASAEGFSMNDPVVANLASTDPRMFVLEVEAQIGWKGPLTVLDRLVLPCLVLLNGLRASEDSSELVRILQGARGRAMILEGIGHLRSFVDSARTLPLIREFLAKVGA